VLLSWEFPSVVVVPTGEVIWSMYVQSSSRWAVIVGMSAWVPASLFRVKLSVAVNVECDIFRGDIGCTSRYLVSLHCRRPILIPDRDLPDTV
jgi:hypothetical protein